MTSIEQAREALDQWRYEICYGPEGEENYAFVYDADGALVSNLKTHHAKAVVDAMNSPTTPVDGGGGAEPRVKPLEWERVARAQSRKLHAVLHVPGVKEVLAQLSWTDDAALLANPEAEARLRERVAELEKLRNEDMLAFEAAQMRRDEQNIQLRNRALAAEAHLAQAEGGPAVTEAYAFEYNGEGYSATGERAPQPNAEQVTETMVERAAKAIVETDNASEGLTFTELSRAMARAALEAALHPQSAAGETGT